MAQFLYVCYHKKRPTVWLVNTNVFTFFQLVILQLIKKKKPKKKPSNQSITSKKPGSRMKAVSEVPMH